MTYYSNIYNCYKDKFKKNYTDQFKKYDLSFYFKICD